MFNWNYGMIKVAQEGEDEIGMIAEVVYNEQGEIEGFSKADVITIDELEMVHKDVASQKGKLLTYFYDNGTFTHDAQMVNDEVIHTYRWKPNSDDSKSPSE